jgi:hypothetical protein
VRQRVKQTQRILHSDQGGEGRGRNMIKGNRKDNRKGDEKDNRNGDRKDNRKGDQKDNRKEKDDIEGRKKIKHKFDRRKVTKKIADQTTGKRMRITKQKQTLEPKSVKMHEGKVSLIEQPGKDTRGEGKLYPHQQREKNIEEETTNIKKETFQIKKVKKIRKAIQGHGFGAKTTSLYVNDIIKHESEEKKDEAK